MERLSRHSKKRKPVSCFFGLHGNFAPSFDRGEILEKITEILKVGENVAVLAIEHSYSIFSTKEEA